MTFVYYIDVHLDTKDTNKGRREKFVILFVRTGRLKGLYFTPRSRCSHRSKGTFAPPEFERSVITAAGEKVVEEGKTPPCQNQSALRWVARDRSATGGLWRRKAVVSSCGSNSPPLLSLQREQQPQQPAAEQNRGIADLMGALIHHRSLINLKDDFN